MATVIALIYLDAAEDVNVQVLVPLDVVEFRQLDEGIEDVEKDTVVYARSVPDLFTAVYGQTSELIEMVWAVKPKDNELVIEVDVKATVARLKVVWKFSILYFVEPSIKYSLALMTIEGITAW